MTEFSFRDSAHNYGHRPYPVKRQARVVVFKQPTLKLARHDRLVRNLQSSGRLREVGGGARCNAAGGGGVTSGNFTHPNPLVYMRLPPCGGVEESTCCGADARLDWFEGNRLPVAALRHSYQGETPTYTLSATLITRPP